MPKTFTRVEIAFYPEYVNFWLRFGVPDEQHDLDRRRSVAFFRSKRVFGYVRWSANEYGTQVWCCTVVRTEGPSCCLSRVKGVHPGAEVLLAATGNAKVKHALLQIDALESDRFEPADVSPAYYRHVHNRIATGRPTRCYSNAQHAAYLAARRLAS